MSKIITGAKFGRSKDLNGNPILGVSHPEVNDTFDRASVRCGAGQVWAIPDGHKYTPVRALPDTDVYRNCVEVSVLSPTGDVLENRVVAISAFAAYKLEHDPSVVMPERREIPHTGAVAQMLKVGVPEDFALAQGIIEAELARGLNFVSAALRRVTSHVNEASEAIGHTPWLPFAAALGQVGNMLHQMAGAVLNLSTAAEGPALRELEPNDLMLLALIATAPPEGYDFATLANRAAAMIGPAGLAAFQSRVKPMIELGWLAPAPGTEDGNVTHIVPGARMFSVIFHPLAEATKPGDLN